MHITRHEAVDKLIGCDILIHIDHPVKIMLNKHAGIERTDRGSGDDVPVILAEFPERLDGSGLINTAGSPAGKYKCFLHLTPPIEYYSQSV